MTNMSTPPCVEIVIFGWSACHFLHERSEIGQKQKPNSTFSLLSMETVPTKESVVPPQSDELHESLNIDITLFESQSEPHLSKSTPPNILEVAQKISESDFEFKSASIYNKVYEEYTSWLKARNVSPDYVSSNCLLAYLYHLKTVLSAPTIISRMSMIKAKIMKLYNRNIFQEFPKLMMEMKKMNEKHTKKKASNIKPKRTVSQNFNFTFLPILTTRTCVLCSSGLVICNIFPRKLPPMPSTT